MLAPALIGGGAGTASAKERSAGVGQAPATDLSGPLVELPRAGRGVEEDELRCHAHIFPRGCDSHGGYAAIR